MTIKGSIFLMNVLPDMYVCPLRKKSAPLLPEGTVKWQDRKYIEVFKCNKQKLDYNQNDDLSGN